jgi:putative ABC transport system permease protein
VIAAVLRGWLRARPLHGLLGALAVALGVAALVGVRIILSGLDDQASAAQQARAGGSDLDVRAAAGPGLGGDDLARLRAVPGVAAVSPLLEKSTTARISPAAVEGIEVPVVGLVDGQAALRPVRLAAGRLPRAGSLTEVALDDGVAVALRSTAGGAGVGSTGSAAPAPGAVTVGERILLVTLAGDRPFTVVGLTAPGVGGPAFPGPSAYVSEAAARGPFDLGLRAPLAALRLVPGAGAAAVARAVGVSLGGGVLAVDPRAGAAPALAQLRPLLLLVLALAGAICAGVSANTTGLAASERRREIGLLRAAGLGPRGVLHLLLAEAMVLGTAGAVAGVAAGAALGHLATGRLVAGDAALADVALDPWLLGAAAASGVAAAVLGALPAALTASRVPPLAALRDSAEPRPGPAPWRTALAGVCLAAIGVVAARSTAVSAVAAGVAGVLLGLVLCLPLLAGPLLRGVAAVVSPLAPTAPVAAAALARRRRRTALTLAGLVVSVATATALSALGSGALAAGDRWVTGMFAGDIVVHSPAPQPGTVAQAIAAAPGVRGVTPVRFLSAVAGGSPLGVAAVDPAAYRTSGALDVVDGDRRAAFAGLAAGPAVLVPQDLAAELGWHRGTPLSLTAGDRQLPVRVAGIVAHSLPGGDGREAVLMAGGTARRLYGSSAGGFDDLEVTSSGGSALPDVARLAADYGMSAVSVDSIRDDARQSLGRTLGLLGVLGWLAVGIAMLAVINTLLVNARQGSRDLALLRAAGLSRRRAVRLQLTEAGLLAGTGSVLGLVAGCGLALPMLRAGSSPGFAPQFALPVEAALAALAAVVVGSLLTAALPARRASRAAIVAAIRER